MRVTKMLQHTPNGISLRRGWKGALLLSGTGLLVLLWFSSGWVSLPPVKISPQPLAVAFIDAPELMSWIESGRAFHLVDARRVSEFDAGHLPGAVSVRHRRISDGGNQAPVVFYCAHPPVSDLDPCFRTIVTELQNTTRQVYWFKGGLATWRSKGYPLEKF